MRLSYWERRHLEQERDVVIVGAGFVGLSAAIQLRRLRPEFSILVIDKSTIGAAASTKNAGFACFGSVSEIMTDIGLYGEAVVSELVNKRRKGIETIKRRYSPDKIGYNPSGGYEVFYNQDDFEKWNVHIDAVNRLLDEEVFKVCHTPSTFDMHQLSIFNCAEGQLDTSKFYYTVCKEIQEKNIELIRGVEVDDVRSSIGQINCKIGNTKVEIKGSNVLLATNALTHSIDESLDVVPVRNQVIITEPIQEHGVKGCFHLDRGYIYFRNVEDRVLIGGARNKFKEEETDELGLNEANVQFLKDHLCKHIIPHIPNDDVVIADQWSGLLSGGDYRMPILKKVSERVTAAVRLGGMGVAIGMDIGIEAATLMLG